MVRRSKHAFVDLGASNEASDSLTDHGNEQVDANYVDLPDMEHISSRLANVRLQSQPGPPRPPTSSSGGSHPDEHSQKRGSYLVDQIPTDMAPSTLSIGGHAREPVPEIPTERELSQLAIDRANFGVFRTFQDACPPPADTLYSVVDQGMSGPDTFRVSMYNIPATAKLRDSTQLPMALWVRPFAKHEVPLADFSQFSGEEMPPRCTRCRAYMNPSMRFIEGGVKFVCNLCLFENVTPSEYYQPLTADGKRVDWAERPELAYGTYEFEVAPPFNAPIPDEEDEAKGAAGVHSGVSIFGASPYPSRKNSAAAAAKNIYGESKPPMKRIFICQSTTDAIQKGILATFVDSVRSACAELDPEEKVAIMFFDERIHFFRKLGNTPRNQLLVMSPNDSAIVPPDVFYSPNSEEDAEAFTNLLDSIPSLFASNDSRGNCFGATLSVALDAMKPGGGRISTVLCTLPNIKPGRLLARNTVMPIGIGNENTRINHQMYAQVSKHFLGIADRAREEGCGIDLVAIPTQAFLDLATVSTVAQQSGGRFFYHPRFVYERDHSSVVDNFMTLVQPAQAREASLRVRCSTGLRVTLSNQYGAYVHQNSDTHKIYMDENTTIMADLKHDSALNPKLDAHFQVAVLYTSPDGSKRVRILNLLAGIATKIKAVLKFVDIDVVLAALVRQTLLQLDREGGHTIRDAVSKKIMDIFGSVRLYAGQGMPLTQLLMPTNLRELIMMGLSLKKSIPLGTRSYSVDARVASAVWLTRATPEELTLALYPRIHDVVAYAEYLQKIDEQSAIASGENGEEEKLNADACVAQSLGSLPLGLRARFTDLMLGSQAHIIFNGQQFYFWLGSGVSKEVLEQLFDVSHLSELNPYIDSLPVLDTELNEAARQLCTALAARVGREWLPLQLVREKLDGAEYYVRQMMVEDSYGDAPAYSKFVTQVHEYAKSYRDMSGWL